MLGGASDRVPTVRVPGRERPRALTSMSCSGFTPGVVYLSSPGPAAAAERLVGSALALCSPGGAHWSFWAPAGAARPPIAASNPATHSTANHFTIAPDTRLLLISSNVVGGTVRPEVSAHRELNRS